MGEIVRPDYLQLVVLWKFYSGFRRADIESRASIMVTWQVLTFKFQDHRVLRVYPLPNRFSKWK